MTIHLQKGLDGEGDFPTRDILRPLAEKVGTARAAAVLVVAVGRFRDLLAIEVKSES